MRSALASIVCLVIATTSVAQPPAWVAVKGQVVLPKASDLPVLPPLVVPNPRPQCLKGPLTDERLLVNPKTRGIQNVVVWLRPAGPDPKAKFKPADIHPDGAKRKPQDVIIDQPCCLFIPRVTVARVGDTITVKNSAAINHNFFWSSANNGDLNVNIPPGLKHVFAKPLVEEASPIQYKCTVHPWMVGYVRIFDHPYYAITDENGKFEIKNAPAGKWSLVYWHESVGFKGGKAGRLGDPIAIPGAENTLEMKPVDFDVK